MINYIAMPPCRCHNVSSLQHNPDYLTTLKKAALENTVRERENAGNQHFLLFPQCLLPYQGEKSSF